MRTFHLLMLVFVLAAAVPAGAAGGGDGWAFGGALGIVASSQDDINYLISSANSGPDGPVSVSQLGNAYEGYIFLQYRFSGSWLAFHFRPSYFYQNEDGRGTSGTYELGVKGYTFFPIARFYMLENNFVKFFSQVGIGIGMVTTEIKDPDASLKASGADMGYLVGLGAEFCFMGGNHCMSVEGNVRYLSIDRLVIDSSSGGGILGLSNTSKGQELEVNDNDLQVTMSGIQGLLGYAYHF